MRIECEDKKYTWQFDEKTCRLTCLRYGQEWRDDTGNGAILALMQKCDDLQTIVQQQLSAESIDPTVPNGNVR